MITTKSWTDFLESANQALIDMGAAFRILNDLDYSMISVPQAKAIMRAMIMLAEAKEALSGPVAELEDEWGYTWEGSE